MSGGRPDITVPRWPRWLIIYFVLAAVNLLAVSAGVVLGGRVMQGYTAALEGARVMSELRTDVRRLAELAADVDAPGNDVFSSHDPALERRRLNEAAAAYDVNSSAMRERLARDVSVRHTIADLDRADASIREVVAEARKVLETQESAPLRATEHMAAMDRHFADANVALRRVQSAIAEQQRGFFEDQFRSAESLHWLERLIAVTALVVVFALLLFGLRMNRGLERRVAERTGELIAATEAVRRSEERFRFVASATQDVIWDWDIDANTAWHSDALVTLTGEAPEPGRPAGWWIDRIHPDDRMRVQEDVGKALENGSARYDQHYRVRRASGEWAHVRDRGFIVRDDAGRAVRVIGSVSDITEMRSAAEAQAQQRAFLRQVIDTIPNFVFVKDREGRFTLVNRALAEAFGTTVENLIGKTDADFDPNTEEVEHFRRKDLEAMDTRSEIFVAEEPITTHDGTVRWLQTVKRPIIEADGSVNLLLGISTDITARREAKEALQRLAAIVEFSDDAISSVDLDGTVRSWNAAAERMFGYSADEMIGQSLLMLREDGGASGRSALLDMIQKGEHLRHLVLRAIRKDGSPASISLTLSPVHDGTGHVTGASLIARDVTETKAAEERVRRSEASLAEAQRIANVGSWERDLATGTTHWSDETFRQMGLAPRSIEPGFDAFMAHVHPEDRAYVAETLRAHTDAQMPFAFVLRFLRRDGEARIFQVRARYERDESGRTTRLRGTSQDITEQQAAETELRRAREAAEDASQAKSDFLANMSHEIRTPMNGVLGMLELALDSSLTPEQRDFLRTAHASADALMEIINDILDFSKIEAGKLELHSLPFDLRQTLTDTTSTLALRAKEKGLELVTEIEPDVPDALEGDAGRLRQVLVNLVGNAIKFTPAGAVALRVGVVETSGTLSTLRFAVSDTGIGIEPEKQRIIFDAFQQADSSTTRQFGGTGLGLAISARLVRLMGGSLQVQSTRGHGSTFSFTVPLVHATDAHAAREPVLAGREDGGVAAAGTTAGAPTRPRRVLLAEDNAVNQKLAVAVLERAGHQVDVVSNGADAVERSDSSDYDVVLMDVQMPGMSGLEATRLIRARESGSPRHLPIIALTARAMKGDREICLAAGMDDYLSKPLRAAELLAAIEAATAGAPAPADGAHAPASDADDTIDTDVLNELVGGDATLLAELVDLFEADAPARVTAMRAALDKGDAPVLRFEAHSLKGASASLTAQRVSRVALQVEKAAAAGELADVPALLDVLEDELARAMSRFSALQGQH